MKRKRLLIFVTAVLGLTSMWRASVYAQDLASTTAAIGAGATLGAAGGSGLLTPSEYAAPATKALNRGSAGDEAGDGGGTGGTARAAQSAGGRTTVTVTTGPRPLSWGADSGDEMVRQLTSTPRAPRRAAKRITTRSSRNSRRLSRMTKAQRSRMVNAKYQKPAVGYLAWYLPEDRYKVTSKVWQFVTTPNDRFYYRPWASSMRTRNASRVIGFHTWQDAMIAGYRPDPISKPEPGLQLSDMARLTRGSMLSIYFEYVYAGQITPATFDANYRYVRYVATTVGSHSHTRHLVGDTVEQALGAAMGRNAPPQSVGAPLPQADAVGGSNGTGRTTRGRSMRGGRSRRTPAALQAGNTDRRAESYNQFGSRAGRLSRRSR